jgi:hypothetical protein
MNNNKRQVATTEMIPVSELQKDSRLKECDQELLTFFKEMYETNLNSEMSEFVFKHGMSYLDALCSIRFDICPRNDKKQIVKVMEMILKKTNELMDEAKEGR